MRRTVALLAGLAMLAGCVSTSVTQLSGNEVLITTEGALACGTGRTQDIAFRQAAAETLKRGFDGFIILDSARGSERYITGFDVNTGMPYYSGGYDQDFVVRMFRSTDPAFGNAIVARDVLGPDWAAIISEPQRWCFNQA